MTQVQKTTNQTPVSVNDKVGETLSTTKPVQEVTEIVRDVGETVIKEVAATLPNMIRSLLGQPLPMDYDPKRASEKQAESVYWRQKFMMSESMRAEEQAKSIEKQQLQIVKVEQIRNTLKTVLTPSVARLAKEIDNSLLTAQATPDVYTEHFLAQMLSLILKLNKKISKTSAWMASMNSRMAKKGPFFMSGKKMQVDAFASGERAVSFGG